MTASLTSRDRCPTEPETYNGFEDDDGCPDKGRVIVRKGKLEILDKIYFHTDSQAIDPIAGPLLDAIAATIKGNPQLRVIEIQGHAASNEIGPAGLSATRALAVYKQLVSRGVRGDRLSSRGYGPASLSPRAATRRPGRKTAGSSS
jgi:outer membrane protein OmpA-like peptidoglycan-associated protein